MPLEVLGYAFVGGLLPPLVWLYFLLKEDSRCPEPKHLIALAFVAGMAAVPLAVFFEHIACGNLGSCTPPTLPVIIAWATIEETLKYVLAAVVIFWRSDVDESIDFVTYMLTVALGFAALENTLFLIAPFSVGHIADGLLTDNLRFIGSTLLHVVASCGIGFALAFSYKWNRGVRMLVASGGLILAIALHTLFNFLIINDDTALRIWAFITVWTGIIGFFALFEILKYIRYRGLPKNTCLPN